MSLSHHDIVESELMILVAKLGELVLVREQGLLVAAMANLWI